MSIHEAPEPSSHLIDRRRAVSLVGLFGLGVVGASLAACSAPAATPAAKPADTAAKPADTAAKPADPAKPAGNAAPPVAKTTKVKLGMLVGVQTPPVLAMQKLKIFEKYNLDVEVINQAGPDAIHTAIRTGAIDLGGVSLHTLAAMRLQGAKVYNVHGMIDFFNDILVKKDSPLKTLADLKGKTVGYYSGAASGNVAMFWVAVQKWYGLEQRDYKNQFGAPPVMSAALGKGEIDAVQMLDPIAIQMIESGDFRTLGNVSADYKKNLGSVPILVTLGATEEFGEKNPQAVTAYIQAYREAVQALNSNADLWKEVATQVGIKTPEGTKLFQERSQPTYVTKWDDAVVADQKRIGQLLMEAAGKDLLPSWPDEAFTTKFNPK